jgi:GDP-4-dehydro-6-deoxy-D-mannose reductase
MRALITGIEGFCGTYLARLLSEQGAQVFGIDRPREDGRPGQSEVGGEIGRGDIRDEEFVFDWVGRSRPDRIYHLAAITTEPVTWEATQALYSININATLNLLEAAKSLLEAVILIPSSSAVYAPPTPEELPLREDAPLLPRNHYGLTKLAQEALGQVYFRKYGLRVVTVRSFNIIGPGQSTAFVGSSLARQIVEAELGLAPPCIAVGNLDPQRDYVDVRDVARAFWLAGEKARPGEVYNICAGRGHSVRQVLDGLLRCSTLASGAVHIKQQAERIRTTDEVLFHYGDCSRLKEATGWRPEIPLEQTLTDLMGYWRQAILDEGQ